MWSEWIEDEEALVSGSGEGWTSSSFERVQNLFRQASTDYLSIDLYLKWFDFMEKMVVESLEALQSGGSKDSPQVTFDDVRDCYESALLRVSHHLSRAGEVWARYRAFEDLVASVLDESEDVASVTRKRSLFLRELSFAHVNLAKMFAEVYAPWEETVGDHKAPLTAEKKAEAQNTFQRSWMEVEARLSYEIDLSDLEETFAETHTPDYARLEGVRRYLKFEQAQTPQNASRIACLFERTLAIYFLVLDIWQSFSQYTLKAPTKLDRRKTLQSALSILRRAIRNYPYSHHMWCQLLLTLEQYQHEVPESIADTRREATEIFERALQAGLQSGSELLLVYKQYLDYSVRNVSNWSDQAQVTAVIGLLESARTYFDSYLPEHVLDVELYWANVAYIRMKNPDQAREVHELSIRRSGTNISAWYAFIQFELQLGKVDLARSVYKRAFAADLEAPETLWTQWMDFERAYGDLASYLFASDKVEKKQKDQALKVASKQAERDLALAEADEVIGGRKHSKAGSDKRHGDSRKSKDMREPIAKKMQKSKDGKAVEVSEKQATRSKPTSGTNSDDTRPYHPHGSSQAKKSMPNFDPVTLHVAGVPASDSVSAADIASLFSDFGEVLEVRFPRNEMGALKGFVFVQFKEANAVKEVRRVIKSEKREFALFHEGVSHPLRVTAAVALKPSSSSSKRGKHAPPIEGLEEYKHTVFVSNLSTSTTVASLEAFIKRIGAPMPTSVRLPLDRKSGLSRCIAYLDFDQEDDVQKVVDMLKDKLLEGRRIKAAPSAPTKERTRVTETGPVTPAPQHTSSLGSLGGKAAEEAERKSTESGASTTKMVPRSVAMRGGQKMRMNLQPSSMDTS